MDILTHPYWPVHCLIDMKPMSYSVRYVLISESEYFYDVRFWGSVYFNVAVLVHVEDSSKVDGICLICICSLLYRKLIKFLTDKHTCHLRLETNVRKTPVSPFSISACWKTGGSTATDQDDSAVYCIHLPRFFSVHIFHFKVVCRMYVRYIHAIMRPFAPSD